MEPEQQTLDARMFAIRKRRHFIEFVCNCIRGECLFVNKKLIGIYCPTFFSASVVVFAFKHETLI